jgi:pimeloyl-ACP methyl ester carboxylesterase
MRSERAPSPSVTEERQFQVDGMTLAAREWGHASGLPLFALHGWLDNAGSFDLLAPLLPKCHLLAVDSAGHGLSDSRGHGASYYAWSDVPDIVAIADSMGWARFGLIGHSRGAATAMLIAAVVPERVAYLVTIDGLVPRSVAPLDAGKRLASTLKQRRLIAKHLSRRYADRESAIVARTQGPPAVTRTTAEIFADRSLRTSPEGHYWRVDSRLMCEPPVELTDAQIEAFVARIATPTLSIVASSSIARAPWRRYISSIPRGREIVLDGSHHLHLEGAQTQLASLIAPLVERDELP